MRNSRDTIAAVATAQGEGGIAIVRVSGPGALQALQAVFARRSEKNERADKTADPAEARPAGALQAVFARQSEKNERADKTPDPAEARPAGALQAVFARQSEKNERADKTPDPAEARPAGALQAVFARQSASDSWQPNRLYYGHLVEGGRAVDEAMAVYMAAPRSYTREDVCEIHVHGGRYAAEKALELLLRQGVRAAEPGEFTLRAFLNGRIDLTQAEAVMAMIAASGEAAARAAARQLEGSLGRFVDRVSRQLTDLVALIEAGNDFPDEVDERATLDRLLQGIDGMAAELGAAVDERAARIVREGLTVALAGAPNAGKSSLMNAILQADRAIVTPVPGTTRDVLNERVRVNGLDMTVLDTAGLRETPDEVEIQGVERARRAIAGADQVILVLDGSVPEGEAERKLLTEADGRYITVLNKCDLGVDPARAGLRISAKTGEGVEALLDELKRRAGTFAATEALLTQPRHIGCAKRAMESLGDARRALEGGMPQDLAAVDLMAALSALGEITGRGATDEVISAVFRNFCVGK